MMNKFTRAGAMTLGLVLTLCVDASAQQVGSVWGHSGGNSTVLASGATSITADPLAHSVGDLVTIVVDLQNTATKVQDTKTNKTTAVAGTINSLVYPNDGTNHGYNFINYHGQVPTVAWNSAQTFDGGGTVANTEVASTTIQARVIDVAPNGVMRVEATRMSKAGEEDTTMILTGLVRPQDLSTSNSISSSRVADLSILQKGKGTLTNNQRKGWLTKLYEFIQPF